MERTRFKSYDIDQRLLLPPDLREWLPEDHLCYFLQEVVNELDLSKIYASYEGGPGGRPAFDPRMMICLLLYGYCVGMASSRKLEKATHESVPFRVLSAGQHPDHDTIAAFRRRHLEALSELFVQVLRLCQQAGLVRLGHVALDGTKVRANASKHKAMSYERMEEKVSELETEVKELLSQAEEADVAEDAQHGKGSRGDELPQELRRRQDRLEKIRQAKLALENEAQAESQRRREEKEEEQKQKAGEEGETREPEASRPEEPEQAVRPKAKAQRNFTDPESRIMRDGATKSFEQSYNCQAAVDDKAQVVVAAEVTQQANDKQQVEPMIEQLKANLSGEKPLALSADAGYFSESNVEHLEQEKIEPFLAVDRQKHGKRPKPPRGRIPSTATVKERMARKLRTKRGQRTYGKRKGTVEPVFGQIKQVRGFRQFLLRGLEAVRGEWKLICLTHNLLKLFRSGRQWQAA
jgi:transposase